MPMNRMAIGMPGEASQPDAVKAGVSEFCCMLIFIFAGEGSVLAFDKLTEGASTTPAGIVAVALAYGFALLAAVSVGANNSGGHVNPAVTFGAVLGGHITLLRAILYWIGQLLGSVLACFLLRFCTGGMTISAFAPSSGVTVGNALVFEIVMTFGLVYTVYATAVDPRKGNVGIMAPLVIGLVASANVLAGRAYSGAAMNPAVAFGPAVVSWSWSHHWIYWVGPFVGAGIAAVVYSVFLLAAEQHTGNFQLLNTETGNEHGSIRSGCV